MKLFYLVVALFVFSVSAYPFNKSLTSNQTRSKTKNIITGAEQSDEYLPYLKGKRVGIVANQTTIIGDRHLVDFLQSKGINVVKAFGPEHGFRGNASAGVEVADEKDPATGIKIISLYGSKRKPTKDDMSDIDVMIYDIQDVGVRFLYKHKYAA